MLSRMAVGAVCGLPDGAWAEVPAPVEEDREKLHRVRYGWILTAKHGAKKGRAGMSSVEQEGAEVDGVCQRDGGRGAGATHAGGRGERVSRGV